MNHGSFRAAQNSSVYDITAEIKQALGNIGIVFLAQRPAGSKSVGYETLPNLAIFLVKSCCAKL
jgi:hypothetical protein